MAGEIADVYLRFEGLVGECNDLKHPGEDGWITIKSFNFGFGFTGQDAAPDENNPQGARPRSSNGTPQSGASSTAQGGALNATTSVGQSGQKSKRVGMKSGPLTFDCISFSKSSDVMSHSLMQACVSGEEIKKVELEACRYGGAQRDEKMPFLNLAFEKVHLKSLKLNLATEGLPTEDVEFEYAKVEMKCMWTDNATGNRLTSQPIGAGWNLESQDEIDEESDDNDNDEG